MIPDDSLFSIQIKEILVREGWVRPSSGYDPTASTLLKGWEGFIIACEKGYDENIYEYDNDISIRKQIETILSSNVLNGYPEFNEFSKSVELLDTQFSKLLQENIRRTDYPNWWQQGVLQYAGEEFAKDFWDAYKIKINVV